MSIRGAYTTEQLDRLEEEASKLTYTEAMMKLTFTTGFTYLSVYEWIKEIVKRYPESRLAAHERATRPRVYAESDDTSLT